MSQTLRVIFAGTPDFAARHLQALLDSQHEVVAVYSQPDRPAGRGKKLQASAVKQLALEHQIEVYQPQSLRNEEAQQQLSALNADVMIVVAYGLILPKVVLDTPKLGCLNVHGSILPRWRGAAPIQRAIWAGDEETGVTIMQMDEGLDTGDMLLKHSLPIQADDTSDSLYQKLAESGPRALLETLEKLPEIQAEKQDEALVTYAEKLSKAEAKIDWNTPAIQLERNIRAFNPWPVAFFEVEQQAVKVWQAELHSDVTGTPGTVLKADKQGIMVATAEGALLLKTIQIPGKKAMSAADVLNARQQWFEIGKQLGE